MYDLQLTRTVMGQRPVIRPAGHVEQDIINRTFVSIPWGENAHPKEERRFRDQDAPAWDGARAAEYPAYRERLIRWAYGTTTPIAEHGESMIDRFTGDARELLRLSLIHI